MDPLELAKVFVKTVVRMFYETEHIVVIDALVFHQALTAPDLVMVLDAGKNTKSALKLVGRLREGGLVSVHTRQEQREGALKATSREWFYIDYRRAIDAAKYKLHMLDERIKQDAKPTSEKKEYVCPQCKSEWTTMEVLDKIDFLGRASGFLCRTCDHPLNSLFSGDNPEPENDDTPAKFNKLFGPLLRLMQQIDDVTVPAQDGEKTVESAIPLPRDSVLNPAAKMEAVSATAGKPTTVRGITTAPEKIEVQIATNQEYTEAARAQEQERQAKVALQNLLPQWHTKSTVTESEYASGVQNTASVSNGVAASSVKAETEVIEEKPSKDQDLDTVFAQLQEEERRKAEEEEDDDDDEEDEDEDDDDFEDALGIEIANGLPEPKRVKLESSSAAPSPANGATPASLAAASGDGGIESDEDEVFEDV